MQVRLVSHASIVITTTGSSIWTDPWTGGNAFNGSWSLLGPVAPMEEALEGVTHLWISHEHPDHFNLPSLRALPDSFKERVTVLFQENNSDKVFKALRHLGFQRFQGLRHRASLQLEPGTSVYCYQVGQMDSVLAVKASEGCSVLNVNDAELSSADSRIIRSDVGAPDVVLNQFSLAGYAGLPSRDTLLPKMAANILEKMVRNHTELGASLTVPIASFVWFSSSDNAYMNRYANRPRDVVEVLTPRACAVDVLFPNESLTVGVSRSAASTEASVTQWDVVFDEVEASTPATSPIVPIEVLAASLAKRSANLHKKYPAGLLWALGSVSVWIPDFQQAVTFSFHTGRLDRSMQLEPACDVTVSSQPLDFLFREPFGMQTLGVSARYSLRKGVRRWKAHRVLLALDNAEIFLKPRLLLTRRNLLHLLRRSRGGSRQLICQIRRMS